MAAALVITAVVASGVAMAQPWAIGFWKRYIRRGTITPYVTGFIELGFSDFGPTIAIDGTLRALNVTELERLHRAIETDLGVSVGEDLVRSASNIGELATDLIALVIDSGPASTTEPPPTGRERSSTE